MIFAFIFTTTLSPALPFGPVQVMEYVVALMGCTVTPIVLFVAPPVLNPVPVQDVALVEVHVRTTEDPLATVMGPSDPFALISALGTAELTVAFALATAPAHCVLPVHDME